MLFFGRFSKNQIIGNGDVNSVFFFALDSTRNMFWRGYEFKTFVSFYLLTIECVYQLVKSSFKLQGLTLFSSQMRLAMSHKFPHYKHFIWIYNFHLRPY